MKSLIAGNKPGMSSAANTKPLRNY